MMEEQHNGPKVLIRKYRYGDEKAIIRLVNEGTMVTVNPFFLRAATREVIVSTKIKNLRLMHYFHNIKDFIELKYKFSSS